MPDGKLNPLRLAPADAARLLSKAGGEPVAEKEIREAIDIGAPVDAGGSIIDANDGNAAQTVYDFCRQSAHAAIVMPSRGKGVTASSTPFCDYRKKPGDRVSEWNWRIPAGKGRSAVRYILFDTNYWKSFVRSRWRVAKGDPGCLSVFGRRPETLRMFSEQMISEYSVRTEGRGRVVDEWKMRPGHTENHLWDCVVGCAVGASEQGIVLSGSSAGARPHKPPVKLSELRKQKR